MGDRLVSQASHTQQPVRIEVGDVSAGFRISSDPQASQEDQALGDAEE